MKYKEVKKCKFLCRPNRFIAVVEVDGKEETVHVKNTGRCKELLIKGCKIYVQHFNSDKRKSHSYENTARYHSKTYGFRGYFPKLYDRV